MKTSLLIFLSSFGSFLVFSQYSIDSTFNLSGTNEFTLYAGNVVNGQKLAYTSDNSIIVAGRWNDQLTVWKYLQNGQLDPTFGQNGLSYISMPANIWTLVKDIEIQNDGKIVVLADALSFYSPNPDYSQCHIALARFLPNGALDVSFNGTGLLMTRPIAGYEYMSRTLEKSAVDHSVFVGGYTSAYGHYTCASAQTDFYAWFVLKVKEDGSFDTSFNGTGLIQSSSAEIAQTVFQPLTYNACVLDIKSLASGKLLFAGGFNGQDHGYFSARLNADGSYDNGYALNGRSPIQNPSIIFTSGDGSYAKIMDNESIVYYSHFTTYGPFGGQDTTLLYVYKLDPAGNNETSFANNGSRELNLLTNQVRLAVDNEQRLVFSWCSLIPSSSQHVGFKRLLSNGMDDLSFGSNGTYIHEPIANDVFMNASTINDINFNTDNQDLTLVTSRSATYVPMTFRVLNYSVDTTNNAAQLNETKTTRLSVFPNPSHGTLQINAPMDGTFVLIDVTGKEVDYGKFDAGMTTITFGPKVQDGMYIMEFQGPQGFCDRERILVHEK